MQTCQCVITTRSIFVVRAGNARKHVDVGHVRKTLAQVPQKPFVEESNPDIILVELVQPRNLLIIGFPATTRIDRERLGLP